MVTAKLFVPARGFFQVSSGEGVTDEKGPPHRALCARDLPAPVVEAQLRSNLHAFGDLVAFWAFSTIRRISIATKIWSLFLPVRSDRIPASTSFVTLYEAAAGVTCRKSEARPMVIEGTWNK